MPRPLATKTLALRSPKRFTMASVHMRATAAHEPSVEQAETTSGRHDDVAVLASPPQPCSGCGGRLARVKVRVALRTRTLLPCELIQNAKDCVRVRPEAGAVLFGKGRIFNFDWAFPPNAPQSDVFDRCAAPLIDGCFDGYNASIFAYGQTSSGKTHTMGSGSHFVSKEDVGLIPRTIGRIFELVEARKDSTTFAIRCQFLEIHNEEVKDLLDPAAATGDPAAARTPVAIREDAKGNIAVVGAREEHVSTEDDLLRLLDFGSSSRTTGDTRMNAYSSRSHAIFTIVIDQSPLASAGSWPEERRLTAKLHLIDLAGSERQKKTGATGNRFKESVTINKGLLALGNVISALSASNEGRRSTHVPYRESKLTRMLQDSLGGNSQTVMIACISPSDKNMEESLNTLKYATRARNVKNAAYVNYNKNPLLSAVDGEGEGKREGEASLGLVQGKQSLLEIHKEDARRIQKLSHEVDAYKSEVGVLSENVRRAEERASRLETLLHASATKDSAVLAAVRRMHECGSIPKDTYDRIMLMSSDGNASASGWVDGRTADAGTRYDSEDNDENALPSTDEPHFPMTSGDPMRAWLDVEEDTNDFSLTESRDEFVIEQEAPSLLDCRNGEAQAYLDDGQEEEERGGGEGMGVGAMVGDADDEGMESTAAASDASKSRDLEHELKELSDNIVRKEELIRHLTRNKEDAERATQSFVSRTAELETQVKEKEVEIGALRQEVDSLDVSIAQGVEEKHELRMAYDTKLGILCEQLQHLRKKLKGGDSSRIDRIKSESLQKIAALETDLVKMRQQHTILKVRVRETQEAYQREVDRKTRELERTRREVDSKDRRIEALEEQNKRQTSLLKRKKEQAASAQRRLKEIALSPARKAPAKKGAGGAAEAGAKAGATTLQKLEDALESLVQRGEIQEQIDSHENRRLELLSERESMLGDLSRYKALRAGRTTGMNCEIEELVCAIEDLDSEIDRMQTKAQGGDDVASKEVATLRAFRADAYARRNDLQNALRSGRTLNSKDEEEARQLEDRLDGVVTELEYVDQRRAECAAELRRAQSSEARLMRLIGGLPRAEVQALLGKYVLRVVDFHTKERRDTARLCELEVRLAERDRSIAHIAGGSRAKDLEYDRRTTRLEREHASRMQDLFSHMGLVTSLGEGSHRTSADDTVKRDANVDGEGCGEGNGEGNGESASVGTGGASQSKDPTADLLRLQLEQIEVMGKENRLVKRENSELKERLRALSEHNESSHTTMEKRLMQMSIRVDESQSLNEGLMAELSNYKKHLQKSGAALRLSRSSLRPLTAEQVHMRVSTSRGLTSSGR